ncbi:hypothetical protein AB4278_11455 [Vibrio splendidus]
MSEVSDQDTDNLLIFTNFISDNMIWIVILVIIVVYRKGFSDLLTRLTGFDLSNGNSKVGVQAAAPSITSTNESKAIEQTDSSQDVPEETTIHVKPDEKDWFPAVNQALDIDDLTKAEAIFEMYKVEEKDPKKLFKSKCVFQYLMYRRGNVSNSLLLLEQLTDKIEDEDKDEDHRFYCLIWLSWALSETEQFEKEIALWTKALNKFESESFKVKVVVELALAYKNNNQLDPAKKVLLDTLTSTNASKNISVLFVSLSAIEEKLGNVLHATFCLDKAVEYNPENLDGMFNAAYSASNNKAPELAICNYNLLTKVSPNNALALNNLGVATSEAGLTIKSVENYRLAAQKENTLAMSNQGYSLLNAGFIDEAEEIADKALKLENTHTNIFDLKSRIEEKRKEEKKKWEELLSNSTKQQVNIRKYTDKYYQGKLSELVGTWVLNKSIEIKIESGNILNVEWETALELLGQKFQCEVTGSIHNATFTGVFSKKPLGRTSQNLFFDQQDRSIECFGYVDKNSLIIFPRSNDEALPSDVTMHRK